MDKYIIERNEYDNGKMISFQTEESTLYVSKNKNLTFIYIDNVFCQIMITTKELKLVHNKEEGHRYSIHTDNDYIRIPDSEIFWKIKDYLELRLVNSDFDDWILQEEYQ